MTRLKKELIKKSTTGDRIRRIKDQKKVVNSKHNVKISEFHVKKLLESVDEQKLAEEKLFETNNNNHITNNDDKDGCNVDEGKEMADSEQKEDLQVTEETKSDMGAVDVGKDKIENNEGTGKHQEEEMQDFELVGLSPESQKTKPDNGNIDDDDGDGDDDDDGVKSTLKEELEDEAKKEQEKETEKAESDEEGEENNQRSILKEELEDEAKKEQEKETEKEESDEEGEENNQRSILKEELEDESKKEQEEETEKEESDEEGEVDNRRRKSNEDEESEDERNGNQSEGESDYHSVSDDERDSDKRSSGAEDQDDDVSHPVKDNDASLQENEEEIKSPTFVPRRTGFWDHDDRFSDIKVQESREPPQGSKKLWDKSAVDRWQHDMYVESDQAPKEQWEVEQSKREFDEGQSGRRGGRGGNSRRGDRNFSDFLQQDGGDNRGRRGPRGGGRGGRGGYRQNRSYGDRDDDGERPSQDVRMSSRNQEQEWPSLNQKQFNDKRSHKRNDNRRKNKEESWGAPIEGTVEDWSKSDKSNQGYPYKGQGTGSRDNSRDSHSGDVSGKRDDRRDNRRIGSEEKQLRKDYGNKQDKRRSHEADNENYQQERSEEYPKKSDNPNKLKGKGRGRGRGRDNDTIDNRPGDNEKTNREKRIDSLPPRLRDKAREKMVQEQSKGKEQPNEEQNKSENGQFEDHSAYNYEDGQIDEGASRDKPKRYSSQRQKTGASVMDIPNQMNDNDATRHYLEQLTYLQQQMSPDKNIRTLEQQILQLQTQLQQQLNLRSMQQPMMSQPNMGMPMPNMVSPLMTGMEQVYGGDSSMYNMSQGIIPNNAGGGEPMGMLNPQINPMVLNQILAAAQQQQQQQAATGLYLPPQNMQPQQPPVLPQQPPPPQQPPLSEGESRRSRPAAIPIKPPPGL